MSNDYFSFKRFTVRHDHCAMKVGTDGVLLGATAAGGRRMLDVGTGTGLVALMMAQRFPTARIDAIDIDDAAVTQATENVCASPFANRIKVTRCDIASYHSAEPYDCIVCNPPFFDEALECPDSQRNMARHTASLSFEALMNSCCRLLAHGGCLTIIVPTDKLLAIERECAFCNMFVNRRLYIKTVERKSPKRVIVEISNVRSDDTVNVTQCLMADSGRSAWYSKVCKDFYL